MCCLFGLLDYSNRFTAKQRQLILHHMATECEERGTDATGISYLSGGRMRIYKRAVKGRYMWFRLPDDASFIMGHTRMTTQGQASRNYNNHPFLGRCGNTSFSLAHNGILWNDRQLRQEHRLPKTSIAQFERDVIADRTKEGLKAARARGRLGGRPRADEGKLKQAVKLYNAGQHTVKEITELTGVKKATLYRAIACK